jgi:hypothetical protein
MGHKAPNLAEIISILWPDRMNDLVWLPHVDVNSFKLYIHWIELGVIDLEIIDAKEECVHCSQWNHSNDCKRRQSSDSLFNLYQASYCLTDFTFQNRVIDELRQHIHKSAYAGESPLSMQQVDRIWKSTFDLCPFWTCILDCLIIGYWATGLDNQLELYNSEFLRDLCNRQMKLRSIEEQARLTALFRQQSFYHYYSDGQTCSI